MSIVLPVYIDLFDWAWQLQIDYPNDAIPRLMDELSWREWTNRVIECPSFSAQGVPSGEWFDDWRAWATALIRCMGV